MSISARYAQLQDWVNQQLPGKVLQIQSLTGDASFRRYYRVATPRTTYVLADVPPDKETTKPFVDIANALNKLNLPVPEVLAHDEAQGFMLLTDLGDDLLLPSLSKRRVDVLYRQAIDLILDAQTRCQPDTLVLPAYSAELLDQELSYFETWYINKHLGKKLTDDQSVLLQETYKILIDSALEQPMRFVHRDYHSRNLLLVPDNKMIIIDFQDAVFGPITYDIVSLLRDCYISWPRDQVLGWLQQYYDQLIGRELMTGVAWSQFVRWFDWMGLQRHLKVMGVFSRLRYRDDKHEHFTHMPRIAKYILDVCGEYTELTPFREFFNNYLVADLK